MLREMHEGDLPALAAYRSDPAVARFQGWTAPYTVDQARKLLAEVRATTFGKPGGFYQIAIAEPQSDALLGDCAVQVLQDGMQAEIGFTLAPASSGRGIMQEALSAVLDHLFGELGLHRAIAITDARNDRAQRLLGRLGFRREGHFLQNVFFKGEWGDEMLFALLASEWSLRRAHEQPSGS